MGAKHSELVQAGGRVHDQCIYIVVCVCVCAGQPLARRDTESRTDVAGRRPGGRTCAS